MQRRSLLRSLLATPPALLLAGCADTPAPRRVVYASAFSLPKSTDEAIWLDFEARVERELPGHDVRLLIRGEAGPEESSFAALRRGRIQIAGGSFAGVATLVPEIALLSLPFLFDTAEEVDYVMDRHMLAPFRELFAAQGLRLIQWSEVGWVHLYSKTPVRLPEDTRGTRVRASSSIASQAFISEIGADMITLPFSDVLPGLQTGLVDAGVTTVTMYTLSGIPKVAPNYALTRHSYDMGVLLANARWMDSLAPAERAVYEKGYGDVAESRRRVRTAVSTLLLALPKQGVSLYEPTPEERESWRAAARPSYEKLVKQAGGASARIYAALLEGKQAWRQAARG